jgi:hypothetical protein
LSRVGIFFLALIAIHHHHTTLEATTLLWCGLANEAALLTEESDTLLLALLPLALLILVTHNHHALFELHHIINLFLPLLAGNMDVILCVSRYNRVCCRVSQPAHGSDMFNPDHYRLVVGFIEITHMRVSGKAPGGCWCWTHDMWCVYHCGNLPVFYQASVLLLAVNAQILLYL